MEEIKIKRSRLFFSQSAVFLLLLLTLRWRLGSATGKMISAPDLREREGRTVRVLTRGVWDLTHYGHADFFRQIKATFGPKTHVLVSVQDDEGVRQRKGALPVFPAKERALLLSSLKWVDQVILDPGSEVSTHKLMVTHHIDEFVYLDPLAVDRAQTGKDDPHLRQVNRADFMNISTTIIIQRIIDILPSNRSTGNEIPPISRRDSSLLLTTEKIGSFSEKQSFPSVYDKVVYAPGSFDLFHVGHLAFLEKAAALGTFLLIGLFSDDVVRGLCGRGFTIMTQKERLLTLLARRQVTDVILDAPVMITPQLLDHFNVSVVVVGRNQGCYGNDRKKEQQQQDTYEEAKKRGILKIVDSGSEITTSTIVDRIGASRTEYIERNRYKIAKEKLFPYR